MKVPISWLKDFLDLPMEDPDELEEILASLGHEVESIEYITPSFEGVVVGKVEEVGPHPNADRVRFCRVNDGTETRDVVCGAWNFETGAIIAYARWALASPLIPTSRSRSEPANEGRRFQRHDRVGP